MRSRTRTFIALPIDPGPKQAVVDLCKQLGRKLDGYRWAHSDTLHFTLAFLGDVETAVIPEMCSLLQDAVAHFAVYDLALRGVGAFPDLRRARTIWVGAKEGTAQTQALQESVVDVLEAFDYRRENRPFVPHVTIGRLRRNARPPQQAAEFLRTFSDWDGGVTTVQSVQVMGSELHPSGPRYTVLGSLELSAV